MLRPDPFMFSILNTDSYDRFSEGKNGGGADH